MMVTLTINGKAYAFAAAASVQELYRRAGVDPAITVLWMKQLQTDYPLEDLTQELRFVGKGSVSARNFVSRPR